jgi:hypothetical protein
MRGLFKRKGSRNWFCNIKLPNGKWVQRSTETDDPIAARAKAGVLQTRALEGDPATNQGRYRLESCLLAMIEVREATGRSDRTIKMYKTKAGHLIRLLGRDTDVNKLTLESIVEYVMKRRAETASQHTIHKEVISLHGALRIAKKQKRYRGDVDELKIPGWEVGYVPRGVMRNDWDGAMGRRADDRRCSLSSTSRNSYRWSGITSAAPSRHPLGSKKGDCCFDTVCVTGPERRSGWAHPGIGSR